MAVKHFLCDYVIEKQGKQTKGGTMQFARNNISEDETEDESFASVKAEYERGGVKLKRETFKEVLATKVPTDEAGNITGRPTVLDVPGGVKPK